MSKEYNEEVQEYIDKCEDILSDWDNDRHFDFIGNVLKWIKDKDHITEKQKDSIDEII